MYKRLENKKTLSKSEKIDLLKKYNEYYYKLIEEKGIEKLNIKIPRTVFNNSLDKIGVLLLEESEKLSKDENVRLFLEENHLPEFMQEILPDNFRLFSLLLNSLKQWVTKESSATDRYLLGGNARIMCKNVSSHCLVTKEVLGNDAELHHPLRDGRPPILLSKKGHKQIEGQIKGIGTQDDPIWIKIKEIRRQRNMSWVQLAEGCNTFLHNKTEAYCRPSAKSFANVVIKETGLDAKKILELMEQNGILK